ncbi:transposase [Thiolapillus sp.]
MVVALASRFWRLGCPKIYHEVATLLDLTGGRVLDIVEGRTENDCKQLIEQALTSEQRAQVTAVALDMWQAYANAVSQALPKADIVHDRSHLSQHLNDAVDSVQRPTLLFCCTASTSSIGKAPWPSFCR